MTTTPPSLFADGTIGSPHTRIDATTSGKSLLELLYDGFYLVFLIKRGYVPDDANHLRNKVRELLDEFELSARRLNNGADEVFSAKYAFCALLDETILSSSLALRREWASNPLQLAFFGDQLAGENFYFKLETLRERGAGAIQALVVFHYCLLLGFRGKYLLEAPEKLALLTARLGDEIAFLRGKRHSFAPFWAIPDQVNHLLRSNTPVTYVLLGVFTLGVVAFLGMSTLLRHSTEDKLKPYNSLLQAPPKAAHLTITLP